MLFRLGRRAIGLVTGFFALLGFIAVPIGDRTAYEHVKLTLATPEGREATATLSRAYSAIQSRLFGWAKEKLDATNGTPGSEPPTGLDPRELVPHIGDRPHGSADSERK